MLDFYLIEIPIDENQFIDFVASRVRDIPGKDDGNCRDTDGIDFNEVRELFPVVAGDTE